MITAIRSDGNLFPAELTISPVEASHVHFYVVSIVNKSEFVKEELMTVLNKAAMVNLEENVMIL